MRKAFALVALVALGSLVAPAVQASVDVDPPPEEPPPPPPPPPPEPV